MVVPAWSVTALSPFQAGTTTLSLASYDPVLSVKDPRFAQGPRGFVHLFGNLCERTASPVLELRDGHLRAVPDQRICLGGASSSNYVPNFPTKHSLRSTSRRQNASDTGWRCAF